MNPEVVDSLRRGEEFWGDRRIGKTTTLLRFIAETGVVDAIVVVSNPHFHAGLWHDLYAGTATRPKFVQQQMSLRGKTEIVFNDEVELDRETRWAIGAGWLRYGGGVRSYPCA